MERLQLYISKSLRGFKTLTHINGTEITRRHLRDLRQALETVAYDSAEKCVFYLLQYVEGATFFTILRTIPDKALDHLAATIAIPEGLEISADDLYRVIREVTRKVSNSGMNSDDIAALRALFAREFPSVSGSARQIPSEGRSFAGRYFGGESGLTLHDFLGDNLYQPMFTAFAGVVLVDAGLPFKITGTDLSDQPLAHIVTIMPPKRVPDYTPHIFRRVFDRPFKAALGSEIDIVWRRAGFEDIVQKITIDADGLRPDPVTTDESRKAISPASFFVTSRTSNEQLPQVTVRVNGVEILDRHTFTRSELENAEVSITAPGFHPYNGRLDLASTTQALIELAERGKSAPTSVPASDPALMRQTAEATRRINSNYHQNNDGKKWWMKLLLMLGGVIAALAVCMLLFPELFGDTSKEPVIPEKTVTDSIEPSASIAAMKMQAGEEAANESSTETNADTKPEASVKDPAKATAFLDGSANGWWSEEALSAYPELAGLYDDLNSYNFDALINTWPKRLPDCEWLKTIATHAANARAKKLDPKTGSHAPRYTASGRIHRREYINWIDRSQK